MLLLAQANILISELVRGFSSLVHRLRMYVVEPFRSEEFAGLLLIFLEHTHLACLAAESRLLAIVRFFGFLTRMGVFEWCSH